VRWQFEHVCPLCAGDTAAVTTSSAAGNQIRAVSRCLTCDAEWLLTVALEMHAAPTPVGIVCGSESGYQRHRTNGEKPCDQCRAAHAAHFQARKHGRPNPRTVLVSS